MTQQSDSGRTPVPDPTKLTTDAVNAATSQWHRELNLQRELIETRLTAMDKATELLAVTLNHVPSETDKAVTGLRELIEMRLAGMDVAIGLTSDGLGRVLGETNKTSAAQREILSGEINAVRGALRDLKEIVETRLSGMDEATKLLATNVDKVPYAILQEAGNLRAYIMSKIEDVSHVSDEKFSAIDGTFASNALALTAALAAQKEAAAEQNKSNTLAITKSEQATKETIAANAAQTSSGQASQAATIADLKERVVRLEAGGLANAVARNDQRADRGVAQTDSSLRMDADFYRSTASRTMISLAVAVVAVVASIVSIIVISLHK